MVKLTRTNVGLRNNPGRWKKTSETDLSELATRMHASPMTFDKRGDLIYWDDYDSPSKHYQDQITVASGGTVVRSIINPKFGDFCI